MIMIRTQWDFMRTHRWRSARNLGRADVWAPWWRAWRVPGSTCWCSPASRTQSPRRDPTRSRSPPDTWWWNEWKLITRSWSSAQSIPHEEMKWNEMNIDLDADAKITAVFNLRNIELNPNLDNVEHFNQIQLFFLQKIQHFNELLKSSYQNKVVSSLRHGLILEREKND